MRRLKARGKMKEKAPVVVEEEEAAISPDIDEELYKVHSKLNSSRSRRERKDSVTPEILAERLKHLQRISNYSYSSSLDDLNKLSELGLGQKTRRHLVYQNNGSSAGAGGKAQHIGSARDNFPVFKHALPEIVLAGHTNSGKSTLVNALAGIHPRHGPAGVSDRAGWTDLICFYQLGKLPPILNLVDLPGYGHAIATSKAVKDWGGMIQKYFTNRYVISRCCVLVDSCRGLCADDRTLIRMLHKSGIQVQIVMTKSDLLPVELLAQSISAVRGDVIELLDSVEKDSSRKKKNAPKQTDPSSREVVTSSSADKRTRHKNDVIKKETVMLDVSLEGSSRPRDVEVVADTAESPDLPESATTTETVCLEDEDELLAILPPIERKVVKQKDNKDENISELRENETPELGATGSSGVKDEAADDRSTKPYSLANVTRPGVWPVRLPASHLVVAVSASTGAGITELWKQIKDSALGTVSKHSSGGVLLPSHAVLEHVNCHLLRKKSVRKRIRLGDIIKKQF